MSSTFDILAKLNSAPKKSAELDVDLEITETDAYEEDLPKYTMSENDLLSCLNYTQKKQSKPNS